MSTSPNNPVSANDVSDKSTAQAVQANQTDNQSFSFVDAEHAVLEFWQKNQVFHQSLRQTQDKPDYVFYDGPPFATGLPHHGHLVASTIKDVIPRYFTMKGFHVQRRFGWDCHGLPIEHEIDKSLGMSAKEAVESLGIARYNDECRGIVQRYTREWEKTITRLGRWVDFENDYRTMEPWYMESVWWVFQQLWDKGLVYQGEKVVPFSTELSTVLSNFEASSNYKDVQDPAATVLFKLADEDVYLAAWTTTPWTLPSNMALCVGGDITYVKVRDREAGVTFWVAESRQEAVCHHRDVEVTERCLGSQLAGKRYQPLFDYFADMAQEGAFQVLADDFVSTDSGTGIVHMAPAFGEDDQRVAKAHGVTASPCPLDERGRFMEVVPDYQGLYVKDADKLILQALKSRQQLYRQETLVHSYPFCPRSDTPIIYRTVPSWYIRVEQMRDALVANNNQINWVPDHLQQGRMGKWLEGAKDWAVSRNRYWGTPIPVWINDETGQQRCIGSREELQRYTGVLVEDLHRDHVDELTFTVEGEPGVYRRIDEVLDCWFESGSMPYAQVHYPFENKAQFESNFPAAFIAEGVDQTRGWFYTLQVLSQCLFGQPAFKNVIVNGIVMAEDGKKMSKRLKNYTAPDILMETYGADALRLYLINSGLVKAEEQRFTDAGVQEMVRRVLLPWLNGYKFFATYAELDGWQWCESAQDSENILDQWILSRLQTLTQTVNDEMQQYHLYNVVPALFEFIEQLTNWYIRLNRSRFWDAGVSRDKVQAYSTLFRCLDTFGKLMAPFAPFLSEHLYQGLNAFRSETDAPLSVHLCEYPQAEPALTKPALEASVTRLQHLVAMGRQKRNDLKIKVKTPLSRVTVLHKKADVLADVQQLSRYIQSELNVKQVDFSEEEAAYIDFYAKPNFPVLGKRLGKAMKQYTRLIEALTDAQLEQLQEQGSIELGGQTFTDQEIVLYRQAKPGTHAVSNRFISLDVDPELTEALIAEGAVREVVSRIQKLRKQSQFNVDDRIRVSLHAPAQLAGWVKRHQDYLTAETLTQELIFSESPDAQSVSFKTEHGQVAISAQVLGDRTE
ncbi:isoleucine--tRNA ligase [Photobacterium sp. TY1-4]|uniref:isoleucine--tRNA ligase n=1 Tax=Photobacterium sp. TY1-4 TaxID=2899122 RepID=UPI0021BE158F|nr:isoleucine--tRNA ligase [Photobacterium sp. TY1-4]UXI04176.1 isoleucine--tRNA ligase [Photobacterium sp. TY1-4]